MAALRVIEDQPNQKIILKPALRPRLIGFLGTLAWFGMIAALFLLPSIGSGKVDWSNIIIVFIVSMLSFGSSLISLAVSANIEIDSTSRSITRSTQVLGFPVRATTLAFKDLANIEVQYYRESSGRSSHDAFRVSAITQDEIRFLLNWDGKRNEMFALAQKISGMTGAALLDNSERQPNQLEQLIDQARKIGVPLPPPKISRDKNVPAVPPSAKPRAAVPQPMRESATSPHPSPLQGEGEGGVTTPSRDYKLNTPTELEQIIASDPTNSQAQYALARKRHAFGEIERAIELYQEVLRLDNSNAEAQNDLGVALHMRSKRADAEAAYRRAIALDPFSFNAHLNLALLLRALNRATEASQEFFQARQNARGVEETRIAEQASSGMKVEARLSGS